MTNTLDAAAKDIGQALVPDPGPHPSLTRRLGTVATTAAGTPPTVSVTIGGTTIANVRFLGPMQPAIGELAWVDFNGADPLIIGKPADQGAGINTGQAVFNRGLEIYNPSSTPYIDFHNAANPAGDGNIDYAWRLILESGASMYLTHPGGTGFNSGFRFFNDGEFQCDHIGVAQDNAGNLGIECLGVTIQGTAGRNWFKDTELSSGTGVRVGAAWGVYGVYAETGDLMLGATSTQVQFQQGCYTMNPTCLQTWNRPVVFSAVANDITHNIYHNTASVDGLHYTSWNGHQWLTVVGGCLLTWDTSGQLFTNYGCGLDGAWVLSSRYAGAATGGALMSTTNGNRVRFAWNGTFTMVVDLTNVKTFVIDHPLDPERYLVHATVEGPEATVVYRGQHRLDQGWVQVDLPDYFEALTEVEGRSVQLTAIADDPADEWCPVLHATYPKDGRFFVGLGSGMIVHDQRFWWEVKAVRKDVPALTVDPRKDDVEVLGDGPYTYYRAKEA